MLSAVEEPQIGFFALWFWRARVRDSDGGSRGKMMAEEMERRLGLVTGAEKGFAERENRCAEGEVGYCLLKSERRRMSETSSASSFPTRPGL